MLVGKRIAVVCMVILLAATGCANKEDGKTEKMALLQRTNPKPMDVIYGQDGDDYRQDNPNEGLITDIKNTVAKEDEVYDVIVVKSGKEVLVVYKVKHLQRFHMKKIEKNVTKHLEEKFPDYTFIVSSDYKIFLEALRLNKNLKDHEVPDKKAKEKFDEIVKLKQELT